MLVPLGFEMADVNTLRYSRKRFRRARSKVEVRFKTPGWKTVCVVGTLAARLVRSTSGPPLHAEMTAIMSSPPKGITNRFDFHSNLQFAKSQSLNPPRSPSSRRSHHTSFWPRNGHSSLVVCPSEEDIDRFVCVASDEVVCSGHESNVSSISTKRWLGCEAVCGIHGKDGRG